MRLILCNAALDCPHSMVWEPVQAKFPILVEFWSAAPVWV